VSFARRSCDLCVVFVGCCCCCDRRCDRGFAQKLRSLRCVRVSSSLLLRLKLRSLRCVRVSSSFLRLKLRSTFCAKVAIFVLYSCVVVVVVVIAIELTIEILCKTCDFLCGGGGCVRACVSFSFLI